MDTKAGRKDAEIPANPGGQIGDYRFLDFTLDPRRQLLIHGADEIRLRPRTYDVLVHLVTHAGRVVGKSELMESVWKDVAVTDDSLVQSLMEIRRALGQAEGIVKTVRGRGYLFDTGVEMVTKEAVPTQGQAPHRDQTTDSRFRFFEPPEAEPRFRQPARRRAIRCHGPRLGNGRVPGRPGFRGASP